MRRIAALLVLVLLLTATAAQAKEGDAEVGRAVLGMLGSCAAVPLFVVIALALYDWRKARRDRGDNPSPTRTVPSGH